MSYKTKPPKKCTKCKNAEKKLKRKKRRRKKSPHSSERSKERIMFKVLSKLMPAEEYIQNGYYSWLLSPKNQPMQLDIYFPRLKLAFE